MRISDWSSDVCSSDLRAERRRRLCKGRVGAQPPQRGLLPRFHKFARDARQLARALFIFPRKRQVVAHDYAECEERADRSEEHTSELQSLMRISYAVFCLKKKKY